MQNLGSSKSIIPFSVGLLQLQTVNSNAITHLNKQASRMHICTNSLQNNSSLIDLYVCQYFSKIDGSRNRCGSRTGRFPTTLCIGGAI